MVNGIELGLFHQTQQMGKLQSNSATRFEGGFETTGKIIDIRNMREDVVAHDEVRLLACARKLLAERFPEEFSQYGNAQLLCSVRSSIGRLDPETRNAGIDKVSQQVAIVGRYFYDEALTIQRELSDYRSCVTGRMREPRG